MWLWAVAACAALIWWAVNRESGGKGGGLGGRAGGGGGGKNAGGLAKRLFNFALFLVALTALLQAPIPWFGTTIAQIGADLAGWLFGLLGLGEVTGAMAEIGLWALLIATVIDLKGKKVDKIARTAVVLAPMLAILSAGPVGTGMETALDNLNSGSVQVVQDIAQ